MIGIRRRVPLAVLMKPNKSSSYEKGKQTQQCPVETSRIGDQDQERQANYDTKSNGKTLVNSGPSQTLLRKMVA